MRDYPALASKPFALIDADDTVCATSVEARDSGVTVGLRPRQAQARCPDVALRPLDFVTRQHEQDTFLQTMAAWGLPVEERGWGAAYLDLRSVAAKAADVQPLCADMGRGLRRQWGETLTPRIGWDSGKFTAFAASNMTRPGQMRLVDHADESRFLNPLTVSLLPLPTLAVQQLGWLGITTLGLYARLPISAVRGRFGPAGALAHRLAQGKDDRPVLPTVQALPDEISIDFEPFTDSHAAAVDHAVKALRPCWQAMTSAMTGCRKLSLTLRFFDSDRSLRSTSCAFVQPVNPVALPETASTLREALGRALTSVAWPGSLVELRIALSGLTELVPEQLSLLAALGFTEDDDPSNPDAERLAFSQAFAPRYGAAIFLRAEVKEATHPVVARRATWAVLGQWV